MRRPRRALAALLAAVAGGALLSPLIAPLAQAAPPTGPGQPPGPRVAGTAVVDRTSAVERKRVDSVKTPKLRWSSCHGSAKCATVRLPRDYDRRRGATVKIALLKRPAKDPARKIGTLFLNPGGPGGSGTEIAFYAPEFLSREVLDRFDIVGFDPRGTNASSNVKCFSSARKQKPVLNRLLSRAFPNGAAEEKKFRSAYDKQARACSTSGRPLSAAVSTAEVARDLDVLRRAVGDAKLSFLGFSYGSYLGQVYANMFPDRVRAVAIDGVVDPIRWAGRSSSKSDPIGDRLRSADGSWRALREILLRCRLAGAAACESAAKGDPVLNFDVVAERLKRKPLVDVDADTGDRFVFGYPELIGAVLGSLYSEFGYADIDYNLTRLIDLTNPDPRARRTPTATRSAFDGLRSRLQQIADRQQSGFDRANFGARYDNGMDAFATITCSDSSNAKNLSRYGAIGAAADRRAKYFGRLWLWNSAACSSTRWTLKDEDSYRGPFATRTAAPVLIVGNSWDPATNVSGAQAAARLLPNSRLLTSDSWGHTAYNTSRCVTASVDGYLLSGRLPGVGATCRGDIQPFTENRPSTTKRTAGELGLLRAPAPVQYTVR